MNEYTYYCTARPASPGAIPAEGIVKVENFPKRFQFAFCKAWGKVTYNRELSSDEISNFELSENKEPQDDFIELLPVNVMKIFKGTDEEAEREERKEEKNRQKLHRLYNMVKDGDLNYIYYDIEIGGETHRHILHPSAKARYNNDLQLSAATFKNGDFQYFSFDLRITDIKKFDREFTPHDKVYYNSDFI